jgi:hypothetical protein
VSSPPQRPPRVWRRRATYPPNRYPQCPGLTRPWSAVDHCDLYPRRYQLHCRYAEPARRVASRRDAAGLGRHARRAGGDGCLPSPGAANHHVDAGHLSRAQRRVLAAIEACCSTTLCRHLRAVRRLRPDPHRVRFLSQLALSEVPGASQTVRRPASRPAPGGVVPMALPWWLAIQYQPAPRRALK